ncbi:FAD-dependent oxidoreductase [Paenibacillus daejeonensis]|uniref:FAD-dependent oxidoreductase n=1 Tax=Paenibacillus daejeonensis TaxID=135193 RepID=UPI00036A4BF8|nr:NAD(P)/FAD-dependent oxidoreductase [Paenibacillus daejeonensis]
MRCQVFISGGGVAGLTLGLILAREGIDTVVAERSPGGGLMYKGELLQPKSLKILDNLGLLGHLRRESFTVRTIRMQEQPVDPPPDGEPRRSSRDIVFDYGKLASPYDYALMHPHEELKQLLLDEAQALPSFRWIQPGSFTGLNRDADGRAVSATVDTPDGPLTVTADLFVGAEGRVSRMREEMNTVAKRTDYNHHFLTVSFGRPDTLDEATIISQGSRFLGLFPLPDQQVRTVFLIKPEEFKQMRREGLERFYREYREMRPDLEGYVDEIQRWKDIQLMIPFRHNANRYIRHNIAIMGDAAHNVHPMAGEGMNMAIQDADILGHLISWSYREQRDIEDSLPWYERVRRQRAQFISELSHLSALAYSFDQDVVRRARSHVLKRIEQSDYLHFKYMLNISGLGEWPENLFDRFRQLGVLPGGSSLSKAERLARRFREEEDYPWLSKVGSLAAPGTMNGGEKDA